MLPSLSLPPLDLRCVAAGWSDKCHDRTCSSRRSPAVPACTRDYLKPYRGPKPKQGVSCLSCGGGANIGSWAARRAKLSAPTGRVRMHSGATPGSDQSAAPARATRLSFDRYVLDLSRGCLLLNDIEVSLRPKTFAVLKFLVENSERLVSKDDIFAVVWPNLAVTDD